MSAATRSEMQRLLATEFESRGWDYDLSTVPDILAEVERVGTVKPEQLAGKVSGAYLERVGATRTDFAAAVQNAIGGHTLVPEPSHSVEITHNDHSITVGHGTQVSGNLNTGSQIAIQGESPIDDVLDAVATLVTAGLRGEWNVEAVDNLAQIVASRQDITYDDVQQRAFAAAQQADADTGQVKALLTQIASGTSSGILATGIIAALSHLT